LFFRPLISTSLAVLPILEKTPVEKKKVVFIVIAFVRWLDGTFLDLKGVVFSIVRMLLMVHVML
jgi:hypothetical protein